MGQALRLCGVWWATAGVLAGHEAITTKLTWTLEISRIIHRRCLPCHRAGTSVPLTTYEEARPWAKAIREEVLERRMPPWDAAPGWGEFRDDPSLTQLEIDWIVDWVEGGAPRGKAIYAPHVPGPPEPAPVPPPRGLELSGEHRLTRTIRATGIHAVHAREALQVLAVHPGGRVQPLLWIPLFRRPRTYWFREPVRLPAGVRMIVEGGAIVLTSEPPGR